MNNHKNYEILYYIKSILVLNDFKVDNTKKIKELWFYYFYLVGRVEFTNNYALIFNKKILDIRFCDLESKVYKIKDFKQYFIFWNNHIFLNKIMDITSSEGIQKDHENLKKANNIIDFFFYFVHECSELYSFSWEHFPLFKWLINEICE